MPFFSPKYFGLKKGITNYTGVANHVPFNARIIGANESESQYVYDILANNTTNIRPAAHSTDTHGSNQVNFVTLECFSLPDAPLDAVPRHRLAEGAWRREPDVRPGGLRLAEAKGREQRAGKPGALGKDISGNF